MYLHGELLDRLLPGQAVLIACYFISACFVGSNSFAGFNALFLGVIYTAFTAATYYGLKIYATRVNFGMILGGSVILLFMSLQSAIFWGQYADCESRTRYLLSEEEHRNLSSFKLGPECRNTSAMKSLCTFSVFMFLGYIVQIWFLIRFKNDILVAAPPETENYNSIPSFNTLPTAPDQATGQPAVQIRWDHHQFLCEIQ